MQVIAEQCPLCTAAFTQKTQLGLHNSMHWAAFTVVRKEGDVVESSKTEAQRVAEKMGAGGLF